MARANACVADGDTFCGEICAVLGARLVNKVDVSSRLPLKPDNQVIRRCACGHAGCGDSQVSGQGQLIGATPARVQSGMTRPLLGVPRCDRSANTLRQKSRRPRMQVKFRVFKSYTQSWDDLCAEAAEFATQQGRDRLINLSVSEDDNQGVIVVWYWE